MNYFFFTFIFRTFMKSKRITMTEGKRKEMYIKNRRGIDREKFSDIGT